MARKHILHVKSSQTTTENGKTIPKLPRPQDIEQGEIAINYAAGYERLSIKNSSGNIVSFLNENDVNGLRPYFVTGTIGTENNGVFPVTITSSTTFADAWAAYNAGREVVVSLIVLNNVGYAVKLNAASNTVTNTLYGLFNEDDEMNYFEWTSSSCSLKIITNTIKSLNNSPSSLVIAAGDSYDDAFSKLIKTIADNETTTAAALTDLNDNKVDTDDLADVAFSGSYNDLEDTPTIPTVNNATLTIQKEGTAVATFTANASSNATANIVETDPVFSASAAAGIQSSDITNWNSASTNNHTHTNKSVLDGIDATDVSNWDDANAKKHTHTNKTVLDGITSTDVSNWNGKQDALTFDSTPTANSDNPVTSQGIKTYVDTAINNLPEPMVFKGSLGTGGTITALPTNGSANVGDTYKVITAGTYASKSADEGDTFICLTKTSNANTWELIPSGDEPSGTVTSVGMSVPTGLEVSGSPVTGSGTLAVTFASGYSIPTTTSQTNWDAAYTDKHTHSNKSVLDGISSSDITNWNAAEANVQSDWNATSGDALILNKPTNVSDFTNDAGYRSALIVNVTFSNGTYSADKTTTECRDAFYSGKTVIFRKVDTASTTEWVAYYVYSNNQVNKIDVYASNVTYNRVGSSRNGNIVLSQILYTSQITVSLNIRTYYVPEEEISYGKLENGNWYILNGTYVQSTDLPIDKVYIDEITNKIYRYDGTNFIELSQSNVSMTEITYANLVTAKTNGTLNPGSWYRITDYATTTTQADTQSANHPFDVIVLATSANTLSEEARAIQHSGDTYFANSNLNAWRIWYCLENNKVKYAWADTTNGKGVIYRMIDEWGNDVCYDFKNIQFKRKLTSGQYDPTNGTDTWVYTFNAILAGTQSDNSLGLNLALAGGSGIITICAENVIKPFYDYENQQSVLSGQGEIVLNNNVFLCNAASLQYIQSLFVYANKFDANSKGNTFKDMTAENIFGADCKDNTFGDNCTSNVVGNLFKDNTIKHGFSRNVVRNNVHDCQFNWCSDNMFGNNIGQCVFGNPDGVVNSSDSGFYDSTIGNGCSYLSLIGDISRFTIGNGVYSFYTTAITTNNVIVEDGVSYVTLDCPSSDHYTKWCQNITIAQGVSGTNSAQKVITHPTVNDDFQTIYKPANSRTVSV